MALVGVESLAQPLDEAVEIVLVEDVIQSRVERMDGTAWQVLVATHIGVCFARRFRLPIAIGDSVVPGINQVDPLFRARRTQGVSSVFVVQHAYEVGDRDEVKFIGVYESRAHAEAAIARLTERPGFREHPTGFHIDEYELGTDHWVDGFVSLVTIMVPLIDEGVDVWRPVHAEVLAGARYRIVTENSCPEDEQWAFATGDVVRCEERELEGVPVLVAVSAASVSDPGDG